MKFLTVFATLASVLLTATVARADVSDYLGKPLRAIAVEVNGRTDGDDGLERMVEGSVGQPFSMADVRETMAHFFGLGRYEDVHVRASLVEGGVSVVYA